MKSNWIKLVGFAIILILIVWALIFLTVGSHFTDYEYYPNHGVSHDKEKNYWTLNQAFGKTTLCILKGQDEPILGVFAKGRYNTTRLSIVLSKLQTGVLDCESAKIPVYYHSAQGFATNPSKSAKGQIEIVFIKTRRFNIYKP